MTAFFAAHIAEQQRKASGLPPSEPRKREQSFLDRLLRREVIMRTNPLGAAKRYPVGVGVVVRGHRFLVVKHKTYWTTPDATVLIYGREIPVHTSR